MSNNNNKNPIDINRLVYDINANMATEATLKKISINTDILNGEVNIRHLNDTDDSITVFSNNLDIRKLTTEDEIKIPDLTACITGGAINMNLVSGSISLSGDSNIYASNHDIITATDGNLNVNVNNFNNLTLNQSTSSISIPPLTSAKDSITVSGAVSVSGSVSVSNQITGYSTSALQTTANNLLTDIKTKTINSNTDSITVWAGNDDFKIRNLSATVDNVDVGLSTYAWSNATPPFPATRDVLSTQLCGIDDDENLINLKANPTTQALITEISNFPEGITHINIDNFPSVQAVSGSVSVSNFPEGITHINIDNFPSVQAVSGSVSVSNFPEGITHINIDNFPSVQAVSGSVSVSNFPEGITHVYIDNFPASQTINGSVSVSNFPEGITHVYIDNFPASQTINGSVLVSNFPTTQSVSGTVAVSNTSFGVSNFPASQTINGSVSVSNFPEGITHVYIDNFPASQTINGSVLVSNFPTTQSVSGTVAVSNTSFQVSNFPASQTVNGNVSVNTISNFALESNGNLASIKTNTDKFKFAGNNLLTTITNASVTVETGTNPLIIETSTNALDVNITGGTITGADGKAYLYDGSSVNPITSTGVSTKRGIDSYIINDSIDVHCYGSSNGSSFHHLATDSNGQLNVHSKLQDGAGTDLTSSLIGSKQSLDVNVANTIAIPVTGTFYQATQPVSLTDGVDNAEITSINSNLTTSNKGLICNSVLYGLNVSNSQTQPLSLLYNVETGRNQLSVNDFEGNALLNDIITIDSEIRGYSLITAERTTSIKTASESIDTKTTTTNNSLSSIDTKTTTTNNSLSSIDGKLTTTTNTTTGLNVYPILPLGKTYTMSGVGSTGAYIVFAGSALSTLTITSQTWGLSAPKSWYAKSSVASTLNYEYIDNTGATKTGTISLSANVYSGILPLEGGGSGANKIVGINRWWVSSNLAIGNTVLISATSASDSNAIAGGGPTYSNIGVFTCPAGCRAFISNINVGLSQGGTAAGDTVRLFHFSTTGIRTVRHVLANVYTAQSYNINSGNAFGSLGGWLEEGEAFMWAGQSGDANITQRNISCQIMCINY